MYHAPLSARGEADDLLSALTVGRHAGAGAGETLWRLESARVELDEAEQSRGDARRRGSRGTRARESTCADSRARRGQRQRRELCVGQRGETLVFGSVARRRRRARERRPLPPPPLSSPSTPLPLSVTALQVSPWSRPQSTCVHTPPVPSGCGRAPGRDAALSLVSPLLPGDYGTRAGSTARSGRCRVGAGARGRQAPARAGAGTCTGPRWRSSRPGWSRSVGDRQAIGGQSRQQRHADISLDCPLPPGPTDPPSPRPLSPPTPLTSPPHTRTTPHHTTPHPTGPPVHGPLLRRRLRRRAPQDAPGAV